MFRIGSLVAASASRDFPAESASERLWRAPWLLNLACCSWTSHSLHSTRLTKSQILDDLRTWNREHQIPILYVTHHREELFALGEHVVALEDGRIVAQGSPQEVLQRPELESVAQLAGFENILDASLSPRIRSRER